MHESQDRTVTVAGDAQHARWLDLWHGTGPRTCRPPRCYGRVADRSRRLPASGRTAVRKRTPLTCRAAAEQAAAERRRRWNPTRSAWPPGGNPSQDTPGRHRSPYICRA